MAKLNNLSEVFNSLSAFESLLDEKDDKIKSRLQVVYTIVTSLLNNEKINEQIEAFMKSIFDTHMPGDDSSSTVKHYIEKYASLLEMYEDLNEPGNQLSTTQKEKKIEIRKNLVVLKYLIRALATYSHFLYVKSQKEEKKKLEKDEKMDEDDDDDADADEDDYDDADADEDDDDEYETQQTEPKRAKTEESYLDLPLPSLFNEKNLSKLSSKNVYDDIWKSYYHIMMKSIASEVLTPNQSPGGYDKTPNDVETKDDPSVNEDSLHSLVGNPKDDEACEESPFKIGAQSTKTAKSRNPFKNLFKNTSKNTSKRGGSRRKKHNKIRIYRNQTKRMIKT
jgi:hypothetical protein